MWAENRIKIFQGSQVDVDFLNKLTGMVGKFDIIIDDGSHIVNHMLLTFKTLSKYLKVDGLYIIEDILRKDLDIFKSLCYHKTTISPIVGIERLEKLQL